MENARGRQSLRDVNKYLSTSLEPLPSFSTMTSADDTTDYDETCPLLRASNAESQNAGKPKSTPLPKGQLAALCTVRIVEPIAFTQLFPYVNEFMNDLHLTDDPSKIGFYSGLVVRQLIQSHATIAGSH